MNSSHVPHSAPTTQTIDSRSRFLVQTYGHLFGAIIGFTLLQVYLFQSGLAYTIAQTLLGFNWMLIIGAFMVVSWLASRVAHTVESYAMQYLALAGYVVAQAIIFVPLLFIANYYAPGAIQNAAYITLIGFTGLTAIAWTERIDFSFLGGVLKWLGLMALVLIGASIFMGFELGLLFSIGMVAFAGAAILYDTSRILHHYPHHMYVGAALELFASIALMFWYVLRIFIARD